MNNEICTAVDVTGYVILNINAVHTPRTTNAVLLRALRYNYMRTRFSTDILGKLPKLSATSLRMDITTSRVIQKSIPLTS